MAFPLKSLASNKKKISVAMLVAGIIPLNLSPDLVVEVLLKLMPSVENRIFTSKTSTLSKTSMEIFTSSSEVGAG